MMPERFSELCNKEVIDVSDGRRLGYVRDAALDGCGRITALIIPGRRRLFGLLGREDDIIVPWQRIACIGEDLILVQLCDRRPEPPEHGCCR